VGKIALSIEELIYCFYSEGLFEQGNGLKQMFLDGITDEQMDLTLQVVCRTLLSKGFIRYENHKFVLREDISRIISALNYSERTIRASKHDGGKERAISFHVTGDQVYRHTTEHEGQVHLLEDTELSAIDCEVSSLFNILENGTAGNTRLELTQAELEELIGMIDGSEEQWEHYVRDCPAEQQMFVKSLKEVGGLLNTLLFLEYNDDREPVVQDVLLFPNNLHVKWVIVREGETYVISECSRAVLKHLIGDRLLREEVYAAGNDARS
jgi:hypothetical protein